MSQVRRRFDPVAMGFWLGGLALQTASCIQGCFRANIGALLGVWEDRAPASPPRRADEGLTAFQLQVWALLPSEETAGRL